MIDFHVVLIDFKNVKIKECVTLNEDGSYTIFIQETLSREEQKKECYHAITHIYNDDFLRYDVNDIESIAHQI